MSLGEAFDHALLLPCGEFSLLQAIREIAQSLDRVGRLREAIEGEIELPAIGRAAEAEAERGRLVAFGEKIAQREEVAERLGHCFALDEQMLGVHRVTRERLGRGSYHMRNLVIRI